MWIKFYLILQTNLPDILWSNIARETKKIFCMFYAYPHGEAAGWASMKIGHSSVTKTGKFCNIANVESFAILNPVLEIALY